VDDAEENNRISISTYRKITNDYKSTNDEINNTINSLFELSIITYKRLKKEI
jgi:hypothetical protein